MAMEDNWFDKKYGPKFQAVTAKQALGEIARDNRILDAVQEAINDYDKNSLDPTWGGPTRTQAIRTALSVVLTEEAEEAQA